MGCLLKLTEPMFEAVWEGWQVGARPKSPSEIRKAMRIEDKLLGVSLEEENETKLVCPGCRTAFKVAEADRFNWWRTGTRRVIVASAAFIFFEDDEFAFFKETMTGLQPPQPRIRLFAALWDAIEDAEKNWKGAEPELRKRLMEPA